MTWKFVQAADAPEWLWWAYGAMVGGYALIKRGIAAVPQLAEVKKSANQEGGAAMIEFVRAKKRLLWAFVLLLVWTCGYRYAADKAEAEQTALIATYRHSSMVAAEQYALQLKKAQDERQRWYDFSQKQGRKPVKTVSAANEKSRLSENQGRTACGIGLPYSGNGCPKKARCLNPWERSAAERTQLVAGLRQCHPLNCCWRLSDCHAAPSITNWPSNRQKTNMPI